MLENLKIEDPLQLRYFSIPVLHKPHLRRSSDAFNATLVFGPPHYNLR
jgi:hypothetical protein